LSAAQRIMNLCLLPESGLLFHSDPHCAELVVVAGNLLAALIGSEPRAMQMCRSALLSVVSETRIADLPRGTSTKYVVVAASPARRCGTCGRGVDGI
jgi:hypothetical protein